VFEIGSVHEYLNACIKALEEIDTAYEMKIVMCYLLRTEWNCVITVTYLINCVAVCNLFTCAVIPLYNSLWSVIQCKALPLLKIVKGKEGTKF
jgi:hypothetical protein